MKSASMMFLKCHRGRRAIWRGIIESAKASALHGIILATAFFMSSGGVGSKPSEVRRGEKRMALMSAMPARACADVANAVYVFLPTMTMRRR